MKIALVHDYLAQDGGAERVLKAMHELWPDAPIFVLFHDREKIPYFTNTTIHESWLAKMPGINTHYQWYLPFMPGATEQYDLRAFDVVISSTSAFAKGVIISPHTLHLSYCHTPTRFLWADSHEYLADLNYSWAVKAFVPRLLYRLRLWDKLSVDRVDHFIANSHTVQQRINKYYRRQSDVIYPPVDTHLFSIAPQIKNYFIAGGRLVPYKRFDLIVRVFNRLGYPLKIFGTGPELDRLQRYAKANIEFLGRVNDEEKRQLLSEAQAFIHPQLEDFGITTVESLASGRPVIAFAAGGAAETILPGETGVLFPEQSWESLLNAVLHFNASHWDSLAIREHALKFSADTFKLTLQKYVNDRYEEFLKSLDQSTLI